MTYSDRAYELAQQLGEQAAANLRRAGRTVTHDESTGHFVVEASDAKKSPGIGRGGATSKKVPLPTVTAKRGSVRQARTNRSVSRRTSL